MWEKVERVELEAACVVSGALKSAPREAVLAEAGLCEVKRVAEGLWMAEMEKCLRACYDSPKRVWGLRVVPKRLARSGWRECAKTLLEELVPEDVVRQRMVLGDPPGAYGKVSVGTLTVRRVSMWRRKKRKRWNDWSCGELWMCVCTRTVRLYM